MVSTPSSTSMTPVQVLLVDHEQETALVLTRYFERFGIAVTHRRDRNEALIALKTGRFDVVLLNSAAVTGTIARLCASIREVEGCNDIGIMMMSASFAQGVATGDALKTSGVDAHFSKPLILSDIRAKIVELAQRRKEGPPKPATVLPSTKAPSPVVKPAPPATSPVKAPTAAPVTAPVKASAKASVAAGAARNIGEEISLDGAIQGPLDVGRAVIRIARSKATGVLRLSDRDAQVQVAFLSGVPVGAWDNVRDHLLGEMLMKRQQISLEQMHQLNARIHATGERVAEALLALGICDADTALDCIELQARVRVQRALTWTNGALSFTRDQETADRLACTNIDLVAVLLQHGLSPQHADPATRFAEHNGSEVLVRTADFEGGLVAFARTRPQSLLPVVLLREPMTIARLCSEVGQNAREEIFALYVAGLVRLKRDPPDDARSIPRPFAGPDLSTKVLDVPFVSQICAHLLKARGRSLYQLFDLTPAATHAQLEAAVDRLRTTFSPEVLATKRLGPAQAAARELSALVEQAAFVLLDPQRRAAFDDTQATAPQVPVDRESALPFGPEQDFLEGRMALERSDLAAARASFERAVRTRPTDPDYIAHLAWTLLLQGTVPEDMAQAMLDAAAEVNPQAMRPFFFRGLAALRRQDRAAAQHFLLEAARRAPGDPEVERALRSLMIDGGRS